MTLRYQLDPSEPLTFMDVKVGKQVSNSVAIIKAFQGPLPSFVRGEAMAADHESAVVYCRAMLHKLELATLMWPTSGVHLLAFL